MKCQCGAETSHIKSIKGKEYCNNCSEISENRLTENLITRSSARIRMESLKYEGDLLSPKVYNKGLKKIVPNEEFLKRNKERAKHFFTADELNKSGYNKLTKHIKKFDSEVKKDAADFKKDVEHVGDAKKRIKELLK